MSEPTKLPKRLAEWAAQPGVGMPISARGFIEAVRRFSHLGYGFMQQTIEWEWEDVAERMGYPGSAWGPEYHERIIASLTAELAAVKKERDGLREACAVLKARLGDNSNDFTQYCQRCGSPVLRSGADWGYEYRCGTRVGPHNELLLAKWQSRACHENVTRIRELESALEKATNAKEKIPSDPQNNP